LVAGYHLLATPSGHPIEYFVAGVGAPEPVTVFAHGLGGDIATTRPLGSGVPGRKVFFHFHGHVRPPVPPTVWSYADLAGDLAAVADHVGATRALGASLGAGALCALLARRPDRFARVVLYLPAALDQPRLDRPPPVADAALLATVTAPALVLACRDDELHPVEIAQRLAESLPKATLYVFDRPDPVRTARAALRQQIASFLAE